MPMRAESRVRASAGSTLIEALLSIMVVAVALSASLRSVTDSLALQHEIRQRITAARLHADAQEPSQYALPAAWDWPATEQQHLRTRAADYLPGGDIDFGAAATPVSWSGAAADTSLTYPAYDW